jgi:aspartyl-tRNA(Asn)/glutamyl-tRNA(Gln) amidotransferase subunit B
MKQYIPTIGLEVHAELKTQSKMFCDCPNDPEEKHPNVNVCPICLGHPGTLPTINRKAVELILKIGLAIGGDVFKSGRAKFDRKNYFYPDLPKGYQISQYDQPFVVGGSLCGVRIRRIHLEEDTGRLLHTKDASLVDFNRAGVPLMELVTEPVIKDAQEARNFAKELQLLLRYLEASYADMEKGQMRVEANVSLSEEGSKELGTKVEIKNLNSFRAVHDAIAYEIERQKALLLAGEKVRQETRGWDESKGKTVPQRLKEEAHDYRYFPEPDLPPLTPEGFDMDLLKLSIPELPWEKRVRFKAEYGLAHSYVEILVEDREMSDFFEQTISELKADYPNLNPQLAFNYLASDLRGLMREKNITFKEMRLSAENFADLIGLIAEGKISSRGAKDLLKIILETDADPRTLLAQGEFLQISDNEKLMGVVKEVMAEEKTAVSDYKSGKSAAIQFLIGRAMSKLHGRGNPAELKRLFEEMLK